MTDELQDKPPDKRLSPSSTFWTAFCTVFGALRLADEYCLQCLPSMLMLFLPGLLMLFWMPDDCCTDGDADATRTLLHTSERTVLSRMGVYAPPF